MADPSQLSSGLLAQANRYLLAIYGEPDPAKLRQIIPAGLSRLISGERTSFNELDIAPNKPTIAPSPIPSWWPQLGEVYHAHLMDHPLWDRPRAPRLNRAIRLSDPCYAARWNKSALRHEYFSPLGLKHQIATMIFQQGTTYIGLAVSRTRSDFDEHDRSVLNLLGPHVTQAWRTALRIASLPSSGSQSPKGATASRALIVVDPARNTIRMLSPQAGAMLRRYFSTDSEGNGRLPDELHRWLRAQHAQIQVAGLADAPPAPLVVKSRGATLSAHLGQARPDEVLLLLEEQNDPPVPGISALANLTRRESEILSWMVEGKRNTEIAVILGISPRTVEKHVENLFEKLGVETRIDAMRQAMGHSESHHA